MNPRALLLALALAAWPGVACQRIPPSVSVPGYEAQQAAAEKHGEEKLGTSAKPPEFFPAKGAE